MEEVLTNINLQCRICLDMAQTEEEVYAFFEPTEQDFILADVFKHVSGFEVIKEPNMPGNICNSCTTTMIDFNNMLIKFQDSDSYLRKLIENEDCSKGNTNVEHIIISEDIDGKTIFSDINNLKEKELGEVSINVEEYTTVKSSDMPEDISNQLLYETDSELFLKSVKFVCNKCDDTFLKKVGFSQHMIQKHNKVIKPDKYTQYMSEINLKIPKGMPMITQSLLKHSSSNNVCRVCKDTFDTTDDLKTHLKVHKTYICEKCGAAFLRKCDLNDHFVVHSTERRFECTLCSKRLKSRNAFRMHRLTHYDTRNHTCDVCGQSFKDKGTLKTHIKLKHTDERNFPCPKCNLSFKLKSWLKQHYLRRHTERSKDFECVLCGIAYFNKSSLLRHVSEKHTGVVTSRACSVCNKLFSSKGAVNKHLQNAHKIELKYNK